MAQPEQAHVHFAIVPALQGRGVGTRMLEVLARVAWTRDVRVFDASVPRDNNPVLGMLMDSGFAAERRLEGGRLHVSLSLAHTADYRERAAERSETAATASMRAFFEPRTVPLSAPAGGAEDWRGNPQHAARRLHGTA
jgi:ribosomal protein S18 acetylase RimI-like enzyme